jgi:hypothetical protein
MRAAAVTSAQLTPKRLQRRVATDGARVAQALRRAAAAKKRHEARTAETVDAFARDELRAWQQRREQRIKDAKEALRVLQEAVKADLADLADLASFAGEDLEVPVRFKDSPDSSSSDSDSD